MILASGFSISPLPACPIGSIVAHMPNGVPGIAFTSETAKRMQSRSVAARIARREDGQLPTLARLTIVREAIAQVRRAILAVSADDIPNGTDAKGNQLYWSAPDDLAKLAGALDKLLDRERILCGIPLPGQLRPSQPKRMGMASNAQPIDLPALPQPLDVPIEPSPNGSESGQTT